MDCGIVCGWVGVIVVCRYFFFCKFCVEVSFVRSSSLPLMTPGSVMIEAPEVSCVAGMVNVSVRMPPSEDEVVVKMSPCALVSSGSVVLMMVLRVLTSTSHISPKQLIVVGQREASKMSILFVMKTMMLTMVMMMVLMMMVLMMVLRVLTSTLHISHKQLIVA